MAIGADLRSTQVSLRAMYPRVAFGMTWTGMDKAAREYFFDPAPVPPAEHNATMLELVGLIGQLSPANLEKLEQLMLSIGTRVDCDEGVDVARNIVRQKPTV